MQRLFSNFADGWPGVGLLLLRLLTGVGMITLGFGAIGQEIPSLSLILSIVCVISGVLLLIGLFTPVTGAVAAVMKTGLAVSLFSSRTGDPWTFLALAILATALAMIGPGAWSIDARLFGRKHIDLSDR